MRSILAFLIVFPSICLASVRVEIRDSRIDYKPFPVGIRCELTGELKQSHIIFAEIIDEIERGVAFPGSDFITYKKIVTLESSSTISDKGNPLAHDFFDSYSFLRDIGFHRYYQSQFHLPLTQNESLEYAKRSMKAVDLLPDKY